MKRTTTMVWALLALSVATAALVNAYQIDQDGAGHDLHWSSPPVNYKLVLANVPGGSQGEAAVKAAFQTWDDASSNVSVSYGGYAAIGSHQYDSQNVVYWITSNWPYDQRMLAVTSRYFDRSDGHILDADIVFNGQDYTWSVGTWDYDIQNSATHEAGHLLGLGHSTDGRATMYAEAAPGETQKRALNGDDLAGLNAIYGGVDNAPTGSENPSLGGTNVQPASGVSSGGSGGGCSIGSPAARRDPSDLITLAALLSGLWLRRKRFHPERIRMDWRH